MTEKLSATGAAHPLSVHWDFDASDELMVWSPSVHELLAGDNLHLTGSRNDWTARIHPDDREQAVRGFIDLQRGKISRFESICRVQTDGGQHVRARDRAFSVIDKGRIRRIVGVIDLAENISAPAGGSIQRTREMTAAQLEIFVDSLPLLCWEADASGWVYFYNRGWYDYTGATLEQMEGWGWVAVHDPTDLPRMLKVWRNALSTGTAWEDEFRLRGRDGRFRWFLSRATPLRGQDDAVTRWFGSNVDINDQKLALQERERLLQEEQKLRATAEAANREKDDFLAIVSHELRSPLNAVVGWSSVLEKVCREPDKVLDSAVKIQRNAGVLTRLIQDLLDMSRIITGKLTVEKQSIDIGRVVQLAVEDALPKAVSKQIELRTLLLVPQAYVMGSDIRLLQIIGNLIDNAIKFSQEGQPVEVRLTRADSRVEVQVRDWGEGIAAEDLDRVFNKFRQADASSRRSRGGLGLGLSIVRSLVDLHGGNVEARSEGHGKGATFTVRFPECRQGQVAPEPLNLAAHEREPAMSLAGIHVLCVDDDPEAREFLTYSLIQCGATVTCVGSVGECLAAIRIATPDIIISDLMMPEVDGFGLIERVRSNPLARVAQLPVVALTALASEQDRVRALAKGFTTYISKPFNPAYLSRVIRELVHGAGD